MSDRPTWVAVRATVHLAGDGDEPPLQPGDVALVDVRNPAIADLLRGLYLVPLPAWQQPHPPTEDIR